MQSLGENEYYGIGRRQVFLNRGFPGSALSQIRHGREPLTFVIEIEHLQ